MCIRDSFGVSLKMQKNRAVLDIIVDMFPVSAKVGALALAWAILVGVPLGCLAAFKRGKMCIRDRSYPWRAFYKKRTAAFWCEASSYY